MSRPVLFAVDEDAGALRDVKRELGDRYAKHYRIIAMPSSDGASARLEQLAASGEEVALVLSGLRLSDTTGVELMDTARRLHPQAKRCLVIAWGDWGNRELGHAIFGAIARGRVDHYMLRPSKPPDEMFHQAVSSLLLGWADTRRALPYTVNIVAKSWSGRAYELRNVLGRCAIPHAFSLAESDEGRALLAEAGSPEPLPIVIFPDGKALTDPSDAELAKAAGSTVDPERHD